MIVGFTGSKNGLLTVQHERLQDIVSKLDISVFIHGGNRGADTLAHYAVRWMYRTIPICIIPSDRDNGVIITTPMDPAINIILQPQPLAERDEIIVKASHGIIAAVDNVRQHHNSRAWNMIRMARELDIPAIVIWPDGTATIERNQQL